MRLNWFFLWLAMLAFVSLLGSGCSGINASGSVSPATFFLPGLMKADPPAAAPAPVAASLPYTEIAQAQ